MIDRLLRFVPHTLIGGLVIQHVWFWPGMVTILLSLVLLYVRWFQIWRYGRRHRH